jgi:hypothetical protein
MMQAGPVSREEHFRRLNDYRQSREYAGWYRAIGGEAPDPDSLPSLLGQRWEITAELYDEFLNMLPPMGWRGGVFFMCEYTFDDITSRFSREGERYFCEHAPYPPRLA